MSIGTIIVLIILAVVVVLIIRKIVSDRKNGKSCCGSGCTYCAMNEDCNNKRENS